MGFLDRFQGSKTDPMAEVSATAVAHLREQNLKFQKFMLDKVQDLEEKVAMGQQRLSEPDADTADFSDIDSIGSDFNDYVVDTEAQPAGEEDVRISLEAGVLLTEIVEETAPADEPEPEPAKFDSEPEPQPGFAEAAANMDVQTESGTSETELEEAEEPESEIQQLTPEAAEPESDAIKPAKTAPETAIEAMESAENVPPAETVPQEVVVLPPENTAAQEPPSGGGSLQWGWHSLSAQDTDDAGSEQASTDIDPAWEPKADGLDDEAVVAEEDESSQADDDSITGIVAEQSPDEEAQEEDEEFILLGDTREQEDMVDMPLPDELGEFS